MLIWTLSLSHEYYLVSPQVQLYRYVAVFKSWYVLWFRFSPSFYSYLFLWCVRLLVSLGLGMARLLGPLLFI